MEISQYRYCSFFATAAHGGQGNLLRRRANAALTAMSQAAAFGTATRLWEKFHMESITKNTELHPRKVRKILDATADILYVS